MNTSFQKIKELVLNSDISLGEQEELIKALARADDSELKSLTELFSKDTSWIQKISDNYQAKQAAVATENTDLWKRIIKEEEKELKKLEQ